MKEFITQTYSHNIEPKF